MTKRKELMELLKDLPNDKTWLEGVMERLKEKEPVKRPWVGLTAEDRWEIIYATERDERTTVMELAEAKLKEKNT